MSTLIVDTVQGLASGDEELRPNRAAVQATTSGTAFDFTNIPDWVRRITVLLDGVSLSGTDSFLVQVGTSGGFVTSGYDSESSFLTAAGTTVSSSTSGFVVRGTLGSVVVSARMTIENVSGNDWLAAHHGFREDTASTIVGGGVVDAGGALTQVRITRTGTDTFDAGQVNIIYE